jgi:hypothetical protein
MMTRARSRHLRRASICALIVLAVGSLSLLGEEIQAIWYDTFDDASSGWSENTGDTGSVQYRNGKYQVRVTRPNYMWWSWAPCDSVPDNFIVEVKGYARATSLFSYFGVVWGTDSDNLLAFLITPTGWFTVESLRGGKWQASPISWKESNSIDCGENESNTLRVTVDGGHVEVRINNHRVGDFETGTQLDLAAAFTSPTAVSLGAGDSWRVGITGGSFDRSPVDFYFDSFALYELPPAESEGPPSINVDR